MKLSLGPLSSISSHADDAIVLFVNHGALDKGIVP